MWPLTTWPLPFPAPFLTIHPPNPLLQAHCVSWSYLNVHVLFPLDLGIYCCFLLESSPLAPSYLAPSHPSSLSSRISTVFFHPIGTGMSTLPYIDFIYFQVCTCPFTGFSLPLHFSAFGGRAHVLFLIVSQKSEQQVFSKNLNTDWCSRSQWEEGFEKSKKSTVLKSWENDEN